MSSPIPPTPPVPTIPLTPPPTVVPPPARQAQVEIATDKVLAVGIFPSGSPNPATIRIVDLTQAEWDALVTSPPGEKFLDENGNLTIVPPTPVPAPKSAYQTIVTEDVRTSDATAQTMVAWPLAINTLYFARFTIMTFDTGNGVSRVWTAKAAAKRLGAGALLVGTPVIETSMPDTAAASWVLAADVSGNNFRVRITGCLLYTSPSPRDS